MPGGRNEPPPLISREFQNSLDISGYAHSTCSRVNPRRLAQNATSGGLTDRCCPTDGQNPTREFASIQGSNSHLSHAVLLELDEAEPARLVGCAVLDDLHRTGSEALRYKPFCQCLFGLTKRDIADEQSIQSSPPVGLSEYDRFKSTAIVNSLRRV